jgi:transposase
MERSELTALIQEGLSVREIAARLDRSPATVAKWLRLHELRTQRAARRDGVGALRTRRVCPTHGETEFARRGDAGWRCLRCRSEAVARRRRKVKAILVAEAGGRCALCAYDRCVGALQFHHVEPAAKRFSLSDTGVTRSLERAREEARKCVLVCANCHAELETGVSALPYSSSGVPG